MILIVIFSIDKDKNVIVKTTREKGFYIGIDGRFQAQTVREWNEKTEEESTIDKEGILQKRKTTTERKMQGASEGKEMVLEETVEERDSKYPLIVRRYSNSDKDEKVVYYPISPRKVHELQPVKIERRESEVRMMRQYQRGRVRMNQARRYPIENSEKSMPIMYRIVVEENDEEAEYMEALFASRDDAIQYSKTGDMRLRYTEDNAEPKVNGIISILAKAGIFIRDTSR